MSFTLLLPLYRPFRRRPPLSSGDERRPSATAWHGPTVASRDSSSRKGKKGAQAEVEAKHEIAGEIQKEVESLGLVSDGDKLSREPRHLSEDCTVRPYCLILPALSTTWY